MSQSTLPETIIKPIDIINYNQIPGRKYPIIALVGSDGSGKTTVGSHLYQWISKYAPIQFCHLGKQTGGWGRAIARLPGIGRSIDNRIAQKASQTRNKKGAGFFTALIIFMLSMRRFIRFRKMQKLHNKGYIILADRYPQAVIPGPMDGPNLVARSPNNIFVKFLTRCEQKIYTRMAQFQPDLVLRLNVDLPTALLRKPDHRPESLKQKIHDVSRLSFNGAPVVDIDTTLPLDTVLKISQKHIALLLSSYGYSMLGSGPIDMDGRM